MARASGRGLRGVRLDPTHSEKARAKIKTSQIINRLNCFALREHCPATGQLVVMTRDELTAALGLLRKTLPDLTTVTGTMTHTHHNVSDMTDGQLADIIAGRSTGIAEAQISPEDPDTVH